MPPWICDAQRSADARRECASSSPVCEVLGGGGCWRAAVPLQVEASCSIPARLVPGSNRQLPPVQFHHSVGGTPPVADGLGRLSGPVGNNKHAYIKTGVYPGDSPPRLCSHFSRSFFWTRLEGNICFNLLHQRHNVTQSPITLICAFPAPRVFHGGVAQQAARVRLIGHRQLCGRTVAEVKGGTPVSNHEEVLLCARVGYTPLAFPKVGERVTLGGREDTSSFFC